MVTLQGVSFEFGGRFLYREADWDIQPGDRIGLVGRNGTGKSTLLRLMVGEFTPTEGSITRSRDLNIGFLNQDLLGYASGDSLRGVARQGLKGLTQLEADIQQLLTRMEAGEMSDALLHELGDKQTAFERRGGYEMDARVATLLAGLGFLEEDLDRPFETFSGGWRMRALLAQLLLSDPDLLLLDEPTNHLDLPSILWLEQYLLKAGTTFILVSHDRTFMERMANKIVEISHSRLNIFSGNYQYYLQERELRRTLQQSAYENQQKYIAETERFIERFKAKATKASQAQSRVKTLEKLERIEAPEPDEAQVSFRFPPVKRTGNDVMALKNAFKAYDRHTILSGAESLVTRGDKIGLVGANGVGKSTVLRILAGTEPFSGQRTLGYNVTQAFFAQHQLEALNPQHSILEAVNDYAYERGETFVRSILGGFLFTGDDVFKQIKMLSGGERSRVALARTLLSEANFLLLDEPTNHLDMPSIHLLAQALNDYEGTYLVVSHDRHFLSLCTQKIWFIEDKVIKEYPGPYAEYEAWQAQRQQDAAVAKKAAPKPAPKAKNPTRPDNTLLSQAEAKVSELEAQLNTVQERFTDPALAGNASEMQVLSQEHDRLTQALNLALAEWERLLEEKPQAVQA